MRALLATDRRRTYAQTVLAGYFYTAVAVGVNLALIPILVGGLGKAAYGIWLTTAALIQWGTVGTGWLAPGFIKKIGDHLARQESMLAAQAVGNARRLYRAIGVAVVALAVVVSTRSELGLFGGEVTPEIRATILLAAAWLAFQVESQIQVAVLTAAQRLYVVHVIQAVILLASGVGAAGLVFAGFGLASVAASYAVAAAVGLVIYTLSRRRLVSIPKSTARFDPATLREIFSTTTPYALSVAGYVLLSSDILLLAFLTSPEVVATYGIAYKLIETMLQVIWRIADATQPYVVELNALGDRAGLRRLYQRTNEASLMVGGCLAAAFFFLGDRFLALWVGTEQAADVSVVRFLAVYALLQTLVHASVIFPFSIARMRALGRLQVAEGVFKIALAIVLVPTLGSAGVALASIGAILALTGWYAPAFTMKLLGVRPSRFLAQLLGRAGVLPFVAGGAAWLASEVVPDGHSASAVAMAGAIVAVGVATGAAATVGLRSRGA